MRIVSLVPHATELLFALGLGDEVVAVTHECDHPPQARERRRVTRDALPAGMSAREIDTAVLADGPLAPAEALSIAADLLDQLAAAHAKGVLHRDVKPANVIVDPGHTHATLIDFGLSRSAAITRWLDPSTLGETQADVRTLAAATGRRERGGQLVREAAARIDRVRLAVRSRPRPRVLALEWLDPPYVAGHWTPQMIELAGGQDVAGRPGEPSQTASWETLAAAEPEVVVAMPCGYDAARAHAEALAYAETLERLKARRVVAVDASAYFSRPGPRLISGLELLGHILHPDALPQAPAEAQALEVQPLTVPG